MTDAMRYQRERALIAPRLLGTIFAIQIVVNILVLAWLAALQYEASRTLAEVNQRQISYVRNQNDLQLCAQHEMVIAIRKIGVKLGLPVEDIRPPSVKGIDCGQLS